MDLPTALSITRDAARTGKLDPAERRRLCWISTVCSVYAGYGGPAPRELSDEVRELVRQRDAARAGRNWQESDRIREELKALGFEVRDTAKGTELV